MNDLPPDADPETPGDADDVRPDKEKRRYRITLSYWDSLMDRIINEARADGHFDNLQGEGRPLDLDDNPYAGDRRLAYKILKDNNYTLPWIADRKQILGDLDAFRLKLRRLWREYQLDWDVQASDDQRRDLQQRWQYRLAQLEGEIAGFNRRMQALNLQLPVRHLELASLNLDDELARLGARRYLEPPHAP